MGNLLFCINDIFQERNHRNSHYRHHHGDHIVYFFIKMNQSGQFLFVTFRQRLVKAVSHGRVKTKIRHGQQI